MLTNEPAVGGQTPVVNPGNYSPVTITNTDSIGAFFLGILAIVFMIAWMRSEARNRRLLAKQNPDEGARPADPR